MTGAVLAPFALRTVGLSALGFGLATAAAGVGTVLGSGVAERLGRRVGVGRLVIGCWVLTGTGVAVVAVTPRAGGLVLGAGQLLVGLSMGAENANTLGYRQAVTPDRLQSRMNTTMRSINRAMIVLGAPVGGLVADAIGYRVTLGAAAAGFLLVAVALAATRFRGVRGPAGHADGAGSAGVRSPPRSE